MQPRYSRIVFAKFDEPQAGAPSSGGSSNPFDLLSSPLNGVRMTGVLMVAEEPRDFSGTSQKGKAYKFTQRRLQIWTGRKAVEVSERLPDATAQVPSPRFRDLVPGQQITVRVTSIRPNGLQLNYDVEFES